MNKQKDWKQDFFVKYINVKYFKYEAPLQSEY